MIHMDLEFSASPEVKFIIQRTEAKKQLSLWPAQSRSHWQGIKELPHICQWLESCLFVNFGSRSSHHKCVHSDLVGEIAGPEEKDLTKIPSMYCQ